jgi:hypothetical protein
MNHEVWYTTDNNEFFNVTPSDFDNYGYLLLMKAIIVYWVSIIRGLWLWCLTPLSAIFEWYTTDNNESSIHIIYIISPRRDTDSWVSLFIILFLFYRLCQILDQYNSVVFNTTFSNIWITSWRSVLLVEETLVPGENHQPDDHIVVAFTTYAINAYHH